ncbi:C40 family peptidase [Mycobacterium sp. 21AC1]|uniref:C40 family peptidase n=1 Tax=[Mycobacterium] appelbergii TaxID=2939269 RepID=UPI002938F985|nr:NlpC/P60 family protein [Mycobacterium sp. 21AC1]MDV3130085.1 C40 family peptidase [Mycobacterium sp. 21AC1]
MPSTLVSALAAPLHEVRALVGPGWPAQAAATTLAEVRAGLADIAAAARRSWNQAGGDWSGTAAAAAGQFTSATAAAADALADRAAVLSAGADHAGAAVGRAGTRLQAIVDRFESRAAALEPHLDEPGVAEELLGEAQRSLREALAVVDELRSELDRQAAVVTSGVSPAPMTPPPGFGPVAGPGSGAGWGSASGSGLGSGSPTGAPGGWGTDDLASSAPPEAAALGDPGMFGEGVAVRLPDGGTALAPNAVAASAVRHALTQLGVPYHWGGTTPGVGLDCSGLTQWAYHEAGLNIPRLAQEQDVGAAVAADALRPGDLAVWDGHVAMIVSGNVMIEAGDPVQLSAIRTTNAGQGFHGFFRPTA